VLAELNELKVYFYDQRNKRFIRSVENVSLGIREGTILGVVGESGCGKTVTALSIMGLVESEPGIIEGTFFFRPDDEDADELETTILRGLCTRKNYRRERMYNLFCGLDDYIEFEQSPFTIIKDSEKWLRRTNRVMELIRGKYISMIFQNPGKSLNPYISVGQQLQRTIQRFHREMSKYEVQGYAEELLRSVRLRRPDLVMASFPSSLSIGMAQRIVIAIALCSDPRLLIADEPTTGLDTTNIHRIIELLEELQMERNLALIFISHNIRIVSAIATDILVMYAGIVVERGTRAEVTKTKRGPRHPYTEALVSSVPGDAEIKRGKRLREISGSVPNNKKEMDSCPFLERCPYAKGSLRRKCRSACPEPVEVSPMHFIRCYRFYS
jgi:oligopeptide/dipeptide ABC transporter ATP-binding protein